MPDQKNQNKKIKIFKKTKTKRELKCLIYRRTKREDNMKTGKYILDFFMEVLKMKRIRNNIMGRISALALGIMLAAQGLTAFADTAAMRGDVNADGTVDVTDLAVTSAHIKGLQSLDKEAEFRADADGNGNVTVTDIAMIAAHLKGIKALPGANGARELESLSGSVLLGESHGRLIAMTVNAGEETETPDFEYKVIDAETENTERTVKYSRSLSFAGVKKDGTLVMWKCGRDESLSLYFFAPGKDEPEIIKTELRSCMAVLDEASDTVYAVSWDTIYKLTDGGGFEPIMNCQAPDVFVGTDISRKLTAIHDVLEDENDPTKQFIAVSLTTGKVQWMIESGFESMGLAAGFTKDIAVVNDSIAENEDILRCIDITKGEEKGAYKAPERIGNIHTSDKTNNCIVEDQGLNKEVTVFDPLTGKAAYFDIGMEDFAVIDAVCIDKDTWAVNALKYSAEGDRVMKTFILDTADTDSVQLCKAY